MSEEEVGDSQATGQLGAVGWEAFIGLLGTLWAGIVQWGYDTHRALGLPVVNNVIRRPMYPAVGRDPIIASYASQSGVNDELDFWNERLITGPDSLTYIVAKPPVLSLVSVPLPTSPVDMSGQFPSVVNLQANIAPNIPISNIPSNRSNCCIPAQNFSDPGAINQSCATQASINNAISHWWGVVALPLLIDAMFSSKVELVPARSSWTTDDFTKWGGARLP